MFTGAVPLEEFKREHTLEYNELVASGKLKDYLVDIPSPAMKLGSRILGIVLLGCGLNTASAVVITFADPAVALCIVRAVRALRRDVPVLVRTQDDGGLDELMRAGATEVVPEALESSLMLASHALVVMGVPLRRVVPLIGMIDLTPLVAILILSFIAGALRQV